MNQFDIEFLKQLDGVQASFEATDVTQHPHFVFLAAFEAEVTQLASSSLAHELTANIKVDISDGGGDLEKFKVFGARFATLAVAGYRKFASEPAISAAMRAHLIRSIHFKYDNE